MTFIFLYFRSSTKHYVSTSFYYGEACSERNTAFLSTELRFQLNGTTKCLDITSVPNMPFNKKVLRSSKYISFFKNVSSADTLYADHMNLRTFPIFLFRKLPNLETIDLSGNKLKLIPTRMSKIAKRLNELLLADNNIRIPRERPLLYSTSIKTLMLSNNGITELYKHTFAMIPTLEVLYLDNNKIQSITPISHVLPHLKYLHVGKNYLQYIPPKEFISTSLIHFITKSQQPSKKIKREENKSTY